ncbi:glucuronide transporter [Prauserella sp. PE36]|uniref:glucuronide transporter n=1 Tax=Prauserella sp. PE36 TaxID=1504709 RepID=UPI000DE3DFD8|nr:glucuronide transporter [Prauserella sp. PE36]RBM21869.1 glucuronide transporter [Prauserella sp. PE36]
MTTTTKEGASRSGKLSWASIVGYGAGDAGNNLAFMMSTMFLLVYYTDVVGISAAAVGTMFLVLRVVDAFTDLIAGRVVDRVNTRWGKFRPFILFGSVPLLLLSVATFNVPELGESGALLYAYLTYAALGIAYTLVNIPYGSLAAAMTQDAAERSKLSVARSLGSATVAALLGAVLAPTLSKSNDLQAIFTTATLAFVVVGTACYLFLFFTAKERVERAIPRVTLRQSYRVVKSNKPLALLCLSAFLLLSALMAKSTAQIYLIRDVFGALHLMPFLSIGQLVVNFAVAPFVPKIVRRWGKRAAYIASGVVAASGSLVAFVAPNVWVAFTALMLSLPGLSLVTTIIYALEADTVEYGEWKTGVRSEGTIYAVFSFTRKAGQALGGALGAYALALGGYVGSATVQTTGAEWGIRAGAALVPALLTLGAVLIMLAYPLTDKVHATLVQEIRQRRQDTNTDLHEESV